jgi:amino acid permease
MVHHDGNNGDILNPPFDSPQRQSPRIVATFNLVATIVGGGVLSLPLAFEKCGVVFATMLMILSAIITDQSLYLLCLAARKTGATSYGQVGRDAFGPLMDTSISVLLFVFLLFVLTAYMVLLRDIWTPLVNTRVFPNSINGDLVLLAILVLMSPFLVQRTLYSLRFNCYTGFGSVSILCVALVHHAWITFDWSVSKSTVKLFPEQWGDALFAFPIIMLSFLSAFNVLPIQNALLQPTRQRTKSVVNMAVTACFALMYCFGLGGYMFAQEATEGNILLNCNHDTDWMFLLGRIGCGVTIMLALAMMMLPCRDSLLEVVDLIVSSSTAHSTEALPDTIPAGEKTFLLRASNGDTDEEDATLQSQASMTPPPSSIQQIPLVHYGSTLGITLLCYLGAVMAPGVAIVWSLCGSSMAFLIAFFLPAACYVKLEKRGSATDSSATNSCIYWKVFSWFLITFSIVGGAACTTQTILMIEWKSSM